MRSGKLDETSDSAAPESHYDERRPHRSLSDHVLCTWIGRIGASGVPYADRVLPDGCIDIVWKHPSLVVAGPDTGPWPIEHEPLATFVGIRFRPGRAAAFLGVPASALLNRRVDLAEVWSSRVTGELAERLAESATPERAVAVLEAALRARSPDLPPSDPLVDAVVAELARASSAEAGIVSRLANRLGIGERLLHRRCTASVGYGPKTLDRVLRFRRFLAAAHATDGERSLAGLAAACGYSDQAHLTRECRRLAGTTPSDLFKTGR